MLRRDVGVVRGLAGEAVDRAQVDDRAAARREHRRDLVAHREPDAARVRRHDASHTSWSVLSSGAMSPPMPAQLTAKSSRPKRSTVCFDGARHRGSSRTSVATKSALLLLRSSAAQRLLPRVCRRARRRRRCAGARERQGGRETDAGGAPGDERDLPEKSYVVIGVIDAPWSSESVQAVADQSAPPDARGAAGGRGRAACAASPRRALRGARRRALRTTSVSPGPMTAATRRVATSRSRRRRQRARGSPLEQRAQLRRCPPRRSPCAGREPRRSRSDRRPRRRAARGAGCSTRNAMPRSIKVSRRPRSRPSARGAEELALPPRRLVGERASGTGRACPRSTGRSCPWECARGARSARATPRA